MKPSPDCASKPESLRQHSVWMIYGHGIAVTFQAIYFTLIGRMLGSSEYGAFVGVVSLVTVLSPLSGLGMDMILVRNISRDRDSFAVCWGTALRVNFYGFGALLAIAFLIGHFTLRSDLYALIPYIALSDGLFGKLTQLASRAFQGAGYLANTAKLTALTNVARAITACLLFLYAHLRNLHVSAQLWTQIYWLSSFITALIAFIAITKSLGWPKFQKISWAELTDGLSFSLSSSSISVYNDIDKTFLTGSGMFHAAGIYAAAYRVIDVASIPIYAIYTAATPRFFREGERGIGRSVPLAYKLLKRTIPYGIVLAVGMFLLSPLLPYIFGSSFQESSSALRWLCLLPLIRGLHYAWGTTITSASSQWRRTGTQIGAAMLNLALNAWLIPRWSWHGAAIASLLTDGALAISNWGIVEWLRTKEQPSPTVTIHAA
jgi:O-antigen/teichoic acid export membrane protein